MSKKTAMSQVGSRSLAIGNVLERLTVDPVAGEVSEFLGEAATKGLSVAIAGISSACIAPVLGYASLFAGSLWLSWRKEKGDEERLRDLFAEVHDALVKIQSDSERSRRMIEDIYQRKTFVWARIAGNDWAEHRRRVVENVCKELDLRGIESSKPIARLEAMLKDVAALARDTNSRVRMVELGQSETHDELAAIREENAAMAAKLDAFLSQQIKRPEINPIQLQFPPDVLEAAAVLHGRGDKEQQAMADIIARRHEQANRRLDELLADPVAETFRLLTRKGDNWYGAGDFDRAIESYQKAQALQPDDFTARNNLAVTLLQARLGDPEARCRQAISIASSTLDLVSSESAQWAMTHKVLASAHRILPSKSIASLHATEDHYRQAQLVFTIENYAVEWGRIESQLSTVYVDLAQSESPKYLSLARQASRDAMQVLALAGQDIDPVDQAMVLINHSTVLAESPGGNRWETMSEALPAAAAALSVLPQERYPFEWAGAHNQLGVVYSLMPARHQREHNNNMRLAIDSFEKAIAVFSKQSTPESWGNVQNNLGNVWKRIDEGDIREHYDRSICAYNQALSVRTMQIDPQKHAATKFNLALAYQNRPGDNKTSDLRHSISLYRDALKVRKLNDLPYEWVSTMNNLGTAWADLAEQTSERRCEYLREAIGCGKAAMLEAARRRFDVRAVTNSLKYREEAYSAESCGRKIPFDDIAPSQEGAM